MRTRIDAEVALHRSRDGVFLIRESMDRPGEYAVALKYRIIYFLPCLVAIDQSDCLISGS